MTTPTAGAASPERGLGMMNRCRTMLQLVKLREQSAGGDQLRGRALFEHATLAEHDDLVRAFDGGEAVGDHDDRAPLAQLVQRLLNPVLGDAVERVRRFIEN